MSKQPESFYDPNKLNKFFAIAALVLLAGLGGLIIKDYDRKWKRHQEEFQVMEVEKTRTKHEIAKAQLESSSEYQDLVKALEEAQKQHETACAGVNAEQAKIDGFQTELSLISPRYQSAKTNLDVAKFQLEEALGHDAGHLAEKQSIYEGLVKEVASLKLRVEEYETGIKESTAKMAACRETLTELERQKRKLTAETTLLERKLDGIDPAEMSFVNQIANMVRDLPIIDLSRPNEKIQQIVVKDIKDDLIFTQMPRVDRCITCHLGIANPAYENAPQPYTTHPNLELFLSAESAHPMEEFGCTVCHGGRGRGTDFTSAVHTPSSPEQQEAWEKKYDWKEFHHWEQPMLPVEYTQAGCFKCHSDEAVIKGAEKLNLGLHLIEKAGCYNCHVVDKYTHWPKSGPNLAVVSSKLTKKFVYNWIFNPQSFRENTWMPHYFLQPNNSSIEDIARSEQEVHAITHYLFAKSKPYAVEKIPFEGDVNNGEKLVAGLGCMACHEIEPDNPDEPASREHLRKEFGPYLTGLGSKVSKEWLYDWLKNPASYHPQTRMPDMRLTDKEAADIAAYLLADKNTEFEAKAVPAVDEPVLNKIVSKFLAGAYTAKQTDQKLAAMSLDDKLLYAGERLIGHYGCYSCHIIEGFESSKPIGIELTHEGDKPLNKLDFGFIHIEHSKWAWFKQKLMEPRIFDHGKVKGFSEKLIMPNFYLKEEEADAIVTALLGFVDQSTVANKKPEQTPKTKFMREGEDLAKQLNCASCHIIEGEGGGIRKTVEQWLMKYEGHTDAEASKIHESFSPPNLHGIGKKINPKWLFEFLHQPKTVRPWLTVRMPTYTFNASHLNMLVRYFNYLDNEDFPFYSDVNEELTKEEYEQAEKLFSSEYFDCTKCHVVGDQLPSGSQETWAPNLALAKTRLKPGWLYEWIKNPPALMPGTKMPTFFDPNDYENAGPEDIMGGDENEQIRILRNYLMTLSPDDTRPADKPATPPAQ